MAFQVTPISFALEILLDCTTIEEAHKACRKYIKQIEKGGEPLSIRARAPAPAQVAGSAQSPSTIARMAALGLNPEAPALPTQPVQSKVSMPTAQTDRETGRAMVQTGRGTFGPRKF